MHPEMKRRLERIQHLSSAVDSVAIFNLESSPDPNFFYFTNSDVNGIFYYDFSRPVIFTSAMEHGRAKKSWVKSVEPKTDKAIKEIRGKITGINENRLPVEILRKLGRTKNIAAGLERARLIKTRYEISRIKSACSIAKAVWRKIEGEMSKKATEREMKGMIDFMISRYGAEPSFSTIVASGKNSRYPHHMPTGKKLQDPVMIDFGTRFDGYCSDMTRTTGSSLQGLLEKVIEEVEAIIEPGMEASRAEIFVRKKLGKKEKFFIHSLGHGLGIEVHEKPTLSKNSSDILKPGMVFTIEPGIYKSEGIRIENDYLLTENGLQRLT